MHRLERLRSEVLAPCATEQNYARFLFAEGLAAHYDDPSPIARAYGIERIFLGGDKHVYADDLICGSVRGKYSRKVPEAAMKRAQRIVESYGTRRFVTNADHFAPDYAEFLQDGVQGTLEKIRRSMRDHENDPDGEKKLAYLKASEIAMSAFGGMIAQYADEAERMASACPGARENLLEAARVCRKVASQPPETFREAVQLMWMVHIAFRWEDRDAQAFGRMDQFLYPYYTADIEAGRITRDEAAELLGWRW